jgi:exonuclease III
VKLTDAINKMDLTDMYRIFHPKTKEFTLFSPPHGTFSKTDHIMGHKTNPNRHKKIEIIPCIQSGHNGLRLDISENQNNRVLTY